MRVLRTQNVVGGIVLSILVVCGLSGATADGLPERRWGVPTCAVPEAERLEKSVLWQASLDDPAAKIAYRAMVDAHAARLNDCRSRTWPQRQAVWLRLYPYDAQPGVLEDVLDRIVNRGYNQVFVEVFYEGRVMLPVSDNPTVWRSILHESVAAGEVSADFDLWAETIRRGQERGVEVHGWMFALNFGWAYGEVPNRQMTLARNGLGDTSIANATWDPSEVADGRAFYEDPSELEHLFVDPFSEVARADFAVALDALLARNPDGMLFDYIRYPTVYLQDTLITQPQQLWVYSPASRQALLESLANDRERTLMNAYLDSGELSREQIQQTIDDYPNSPLPFELKITTSGVHTSNRHPETLKPETSHLTSVSPDDFTEETLEQYRQYFWQLATNHAYRGVIEFAEFAASPVRERSLPVATVFFPQGNLSQDGAFDARMQPWDRFPQDLQRHPMSYATCPDGVCVTQQVEEVVLQSSQSQVCPILAGTWGQPFAGHLALETQMTLLEDSLPSLECISHFVYAWMEPDSDRDRKAGNGVGEDLP